MVVSPCAMSGTDIGMAVSPYATSGTGIAHGGISLRDVRYLYSIWRYLPTRRPVLTCRMGAARNSVWPRFAMRCAVLTERMVRPGTQTATRRYQQPTSVLPDVRY
eukprot:3649475-Rhodomonas_salina.2